MNCNNIAMCCIFLHFFAFLCNVHHTSLYYTLYTDVYYKPYTLVRIIHRPSLPSCTPPPAKVLILRLLFVSKIYRCSLAHLCHGMPYKVVTKIESSLKLLSKVEILHSLKYVYQSNSVIEDFLKLRQTQNFTAVNE